MSLCKNMIKFTSVMNPISMKTSIIVSIDTLNRLVGEMICVFKYAITHVKYLTRRTFG